ncbi:MAG: PEP-CTERM sorting domain-containing protein [Candidatus Omnitrophota bacterium]
MKKYAWMFLVCALGLGLFSGTGLAGENDVRAPLPENFSPYMTLDKSLVKTTSFGWDETPLAYFSIPEIDVSRTLNVTRTWKYGTETVAVEQESYPNIASLFHLQALDNWTDKGIRQTGNWSVETLWGYEGSKYSTLRKNAFTVTPEPFSAALFVLGGLAISARKLRGKNRKKKLAVFLGFLLCLGLLTQTGYAYYIDPSDVYPPEAVDYTPFTTLENDESEKTLFGWDEKPFVYSLFDEVDTSRTLNLTRVWKYGTETIATQQESYFDGDGTDYGSGSLEIWKGLDNWTGVSGVRKAGDWTVNTEWGYNGSDYTEFAKSSFTVTPEPVSMVLFGLGAGVLGLAQFRRKKK